MTFHPRSVVEFGRFLTRVSDSLMSGAPLQPSLALIRDHFDGCAAAVRIEDRFSAAHAATTIVETAESVDVESIAAARGARETTRLATLLDTHHHVSASASGDDDMRCTLWVFRPLAESAFDTEEASVCEILAAHLLRGLSLSARMGASEVERALYSRVMDRLSVGVIMLDLGGAMLRASATAEAVLAARDGLQTHGGRLRATSAKEDRELQQAIEAAMRSAAQGDFQATRAVALTKLSGSRTLGVLVQPVRGARGPGLAAAPAIAIYLRDPDANADVESDIVRQLFDLTPAEAAVARRLTAGLSLENAAHSLDISRNTARAHLRSIFSKSGITRQTELVRMMLNSAAVLGERPRQVA